MTVLHTASLSTVVPVYRGAAYLERLVGGLDDLRSTLEREQAPLELIEAIFVDDGSQDGSDAILADLAVHRPWLRVVTLSRSYGQHPATIAGILHSSGDWLATLDEDLQHHPQYLISLLAAAVGEHLDLVYAHPHEGPHRSRLRNVSSRWTKKVLAWLAGNKEIRKFNSFRMVRGSVARAAAAVATRETYYDVALSWFTRRIGILPLPLQDPRAGESGYRLRSLLGHARRMLVSSQIRPLRLGAALGLACLTLSVAGAISVLVIKLARPELVEVRGWTSLMISTFFFGGLVSLLCGIALEYLSDLHLQALGRPTFFVVDRSRDHVLREWLASRK